MRSYLDGPLWVAVDIPHFCWVLVFVDYIDSSKLLPPQKNLTRNSNNWSWKITFRLDIPIFGFHVKFRAGDHPSARWSSFLSAIFFWLIPWALLFFAKEGKDCEAAIKSRKSLQQHHLYVTWHHSEWHLRHPISDRSTPGAGWSASTPKWRSGWWNSSRVLRRAPWRSRSMARCETKSFTHGNIVFIGIYFGFRGFRGFILDLYWKKQMDI